MCENIQWIRDPKNPALLKLFFFFFWKLLTCNIKHIPCIAGFGQYSPAVQFGQCRPATFSPHFSSSILSQLFKIILKPKTCLLHIVSNISLSRPSPHHHSQPSFHYLCSKSYTTPFYKRMLGACVDLFAP